MLGVNELCDCLTHDGVNFSSYSSNVNVINSVVLEMTK